MTNDNKIIQLDSRSLRCKFGFNDGDLIGDIFSKNNIYNISSEREHNILIAVVQKYLLPLLPNDVECEVLCTCHNPIRLVNPKADFQDVSVNVTLEQILLTALTERL